MKLLKVKKLDSYPDTPDDDKNIKRVLQITYKNSWGKIKTRLICSERMYLSPNNYMNNHWQFFDDGSSGELFSMKETFEAICNSNVIFHDFVKKAITLKDMFNNTIVEYY